MINSHDYVEGDYIETWEGLFFAVKGMHHPGNRAISTLRYTPDEEGDRVRNGSRYRRVYDLDKTRKYLEKFHPAYLSYVDELGITVQSVPVNKIKKVYKPREKIRKLTRSPKDKPSKALRRFVEALIKESGVPINYFGVTGSLLVNLQTPDSDIDLNVYGLEESKKVYEALKKLRRVSGWIHPYDKDTVRDVASSRWLDTGLDLEMFIDIETEKILHGLIEDRDYFIRLIKPVNIIGKSHPVRKYTVRGRIIDDDESIYTPCRYVLETELKKELRELVSYRGKFTEQTKSGDPVEVRGTLEKVSYEDKKTYRIILGGKGDYLLPLHAFKR